MNPQTPSLFVQARELVRQGIESAHGVLQGRGLLANADVAKERLEICRQCEFLAKDRCIKCGCFMDKKVHLAVTRCPEGKWGESLPDGAPPEQFRSGAPLASRCHSNEPLDLSGLPEDIRTELLDFAALGLKRGGTFWYKNAELLATRVNGEVKVYKNVRRSTSADLLTPVEREEIRVASRDAASRGADSFVYKGRTYHRNRQPTYSRAQFLEQNVWTDQERAEFSAAQDAARATGESEFVFRGKRFFAPPVPIAVPAPPGDLDPNSL